MVGGQKYPLKNGDLVDVFDSHFRFVYNPDAPKTIDVAVPITDEAKSSFIGMRETPVKSMKKIMSPVEKSIQNSPKRTIPADQCSARKKSRLNEEVSFGSPFTAILTPTHANLAYSSRSTSSFVVDSSTPSQKSVSFGPKVRP